MKLQFLLTYIHMLGKALLVSFIRNFVNVIFNINKYFIKEMLYKSLFLDNKRYILLYICN